MLRIWRSAEKHALTALMTGPHGDTGIDVDTNVPGCSDWRHQGIIIIIIITDLYSAFRSEDTEALDAAGGLSEFE